MGFFSDKFTLCRVEESDLFSSYSNQHAIYSNKIKFKEKDDSSRKKKGSIVNLARFIDKKIRVKFQGGREVKFHLFFFFNLLIKSFHVSSLVHVHDVVLDHVHKPFLSLTQAEMSVPIILFLKKRH